MSNELQVQQFQTVRAAVALAETKFNAVAVDRSINFVREAGFAMQALAANEYAMKVALEDPQSVRDAVTNIAAIGISLNPARKQAYLVPRKPRWDRPAKICLDISYMGLLDLAIAAGSILWGQAELVYAKDVFKLRGTDEQPIHEREPFAKDRGELIGVYCVVKTPSGDYLTTPMSAADVFAIRDRTDGWKAFIEKKARTPWATDEGEMVKKTVIKRAYKTWPKTDRSARLETAIHHLNTEAGEGITFDYEGGAAIDQPAYLGLSGPKVSAPIRRMAGAGLERFNVGDEMGMWGEVGETYMKGDDETEALWLALRPFSDMRSTIKRMAASEREGQAKLEEARAKELAEKRPDLPPVEA